MEVGFVKAIKGYLLEIDGLPGVRINDVLESESGTKAFVFSLGATTVQALLISENPVEIGEQFKKSADGLTIPAGNELLGRVVGPLGEILDGGQKPVMKSAMPLDRAAVGISGRKFINSQLVSGISLIDVLVPLGRGQRELLMGDARSGKTSFILDLIYNLRESDVVCVFASIGRPAQKLWNFVSVLTDAKAFSKVVVVATFPSDPTPLIYLTPKGAMAVAEFYREQGKDVVIIFDDLGLHARIYREISLLLGRFPGREGYPGDIFYQHSSLVERAGSFADGGTITALPIIEINLDDSSGYIPTNLMSMTDGHLLFNSALIAQGKRPGVDVSLSVSRVGRQTQTKVLSELAQKIKQIFSQARQFESISGFGGELPAATKQVLHTKELLDECLKQGEFEVLTISHECMLLTLPFVKLMQDMSVEEFAAQKLSFVDGMKMDPILVEVAKKFESLKSWAELILEMEKLTPKLEQIFKSQNSRDALVDSETWRPRI